MNRYQNAMQPWPALHPCASEIALPASGLRLFAYDAGNPEARRLILVHGLADEADTWRHILPALSTTYRVIAPDLPGFGRSAKPALSYTVPFFADVLRELVDVLQARRVTLIGHSLGAIVAHQFALISPERVDRLVLLAGSLVAASQNLDLAGLAFLVPGLGEWLYNRLRKDPQAAYESLQPYYAQLDALPDADRSFLFQRVNERVWSDGQRRAFFSALRNLARWLPTQQRGLPARLARFPVPTLAIWGQQDRIVAPANGQALARLQPGTRLIVMPGAGHDVQQEQPGAVLAAINNCLDNLAEGE